MSQALDLETFVGMLNDNPTQDCVIDDAALEDFDFSIHDAARLSGREMREGAEYVSGTSFRKRIYVFFRTEKG